MTILGLDYAWQKPSPAAIKAAGYMFVSRYLSWLPNGKVIDSAEAQALLAEGIDIFLNWEFDAQDCLRGADGGTTDAAEAVKQAKALGYPAGATIYHSADFDVTDAQKPVVAEYLTAAAKIEGAAGYRTGCYSGFWTLKYLFDNGVIADGWQTYAWSGGLWDARSALRQVKNGITVDGANCDEDQLVGKASSWMHPGGGDMPLTQDDANLCARTLLTTLLGRSGPTVGVALQSAISAGAGEATVTRQEFTDLTTKVDQVLAAVLALSTGTDHTHTVTATAAGSTGPAVPLTP